MLEEIPGKVPHIMHGRVCASLRGDALLLTLLTALRGPVVKMGKGLALTGPTF